MPQQALAASSSVSTLPTTIQSVLKRFKLDGKGLSIVVQPIDGGAPLLSYNQHSARNPASAIKLFTSYAALEMLGPAYQWSTELYADGELKDGVLNGDLWIKGGGDPYLPIERMWLLVHRLQTSGLHTIKGDLIIDQSLFEAINEDPGAFDRQPLRAYNVVPSALVSNFNVSTFLFKPANTGRGVDVQIVPNLDGLKVVNNLRTVNRSCRGYNRGIAINVDDKGQVILDGQFPSRCKIYGMSRSVMPRDTYTARLFRKLWLESGGQWEGHLRTDRKEFEQDPLLKFDSVFLSQAVRSINKYSNNVMTRMLFLTLGLEKFGAPATTENARLAMDQWLPTKGVPLKNLMIDNGAGSSRQTRATADQFAKLLSAAWQSQYMPELLSSMAISGEDGTFARRHVVGPLKGRAHLKTGRLDHAVSMAGIVQAASDKRYIVVSLHNANDAHRGSGHAVQDALLRWVYAQ
ncbi:MAG: D-alanyl-D-alanine carboxypeptidase/D-alanyl-D-alanine-endopeptidase [Pseudomonadales bacterium]